MEHQTERNSLSENKSLVKGKAEAMKSLFAEPSENTTLPVSVDASESLDELTEGKGSKILRLSLSWAPR